MLRKIRIVLAALCFVCITLLFVGIGHDWWGWLSSLQFLPALTRVIISASLGNIAVLLGIVLFTWLFGRLYCSVLCPLGVFQDLIIWLRKTLGRWIKPLHKKYSFNKERSWVRYPVAALLIASLIVDLQLITALIGPYSAYGRMVLAAVGGGPAQLLIAAGATFVIIAVCAWVWGRAWCNNVCPVGTLLGCVSRFSLLQVRFDEDKCVKCGACAHVCKASCIDDKLHTVDASRCVDCFDCVDFCKLGGLRYGFASPRESAGDRSADPAILSRSPLPMAAESARMDVAGSAAPADAERGEEDEDTPKGTVSRRAFIATGAAVIGAGATAAAQNMKVDGGLAPMEPKVPLEREPRLVPPGSGSVKHFYDACTACQLCIAACSNGVLRPSSDLAHFLQPQMGYENGYCRPECTACTSVCPTDAILPVAREAKTLISIGHASVNAELCLAAKGEAGCGKCARGCPTGAISMVSTDGVRRPVVMESLCIGCGKCEYLCPSRPISAITVNGLETHRNQVLWTGENS